MMATWDNAHETSEAAVKNHPAQACLYDALFRGKTGKLRQAVDAMKAMAAAGTAWADIDCMPGRPTHSLHPEDVPMIQAVAAALKAYAMEE